jgi:hypothetical protein
MNKKLKTIVLDLDATLIHSRELRCSENKDVYKGLKNFENFYIMSDDFIVVERPKGQKFLNYLFENFENLIVWTAASKDYAEFIIDKCIRKDENRQLSWYFFSYHCNLSEDKYSSTKNLKLLREYFHLDECDETSICILDDYSDVADGNPGKCIIAPPFDSENKDSSKDNFFEKLMVCFDRNMDVESINEHFEFTQ